MSGEIAVAAGKAKETDRDRAYGTLRLRVLSGQISEGDAVAAADVQAEFGCTNTAAQHVLRALSADGYLDSGLRHYQGSLWTNDRFDEYLSQMAVFMEIAGNRIVGDNPARLQKLRGLRTSLDNLDPVSEAHYLTCVEWIHVVLEARGRRSFTELVSSIVPQCLLRVAWIAVEGTRACEQAMLQFETALEAEDRVETRAVSYGFWTGLRPLLSDVLMHRKAGSLISQRLKATWKLEPNLSGYVPYFGRSGRTSQALVEPLSPQRRRPQALPDLISAS